MVTFPSIFLPFLCNAITYFWNDSPLRVKIWRAVVYRVHESNLFRNRTRNPQNCLEYVVLNSSHAPRGTSRILYAFCVWSTTIIQLDSAVRARKKNRSRIGIKSPCQGKLLKTRRHQFVSRIQRSQTCLMGATVKKNKLLHWIDIWCEMNQHSNTNDLNVYVRSEL